MKKGKLLGLAGSICLIIVMAALPFMAACAAPPAEEVKPIKVGICSAETGDLVVEWVTIAKIVKMTFDIINEDPPLGRPIQVISSDGMTTVEGEMKVANFLGGQGVAYAVGYCSDGLWAALPTIEKYGTPTFTQWAGSTRLDKTPQGKAGLFFRNCGGDSIMYAVPGLYWEQELAPKGAKTIAVLNATDESSRSAAVEARTNLEKAGAKCVYATEFPPDQITFSRILADAFAANPDVLLVMTSQEQGSIVLKQWYDSSLRKDIPILGLDTWFDLGILIPATGAVDNVLIKANPAVGEDIRKFVGESYDVFIHEYQKVYGQGLIPEDPFAPCMWDAINIGALAIEAAGDPSPAAVSKAIREVSNPPGVKVHS
jgi:ABC-type branched-subunit amino acid transport system substrate-binding protein